MFSAIFGATAPVDPTAPTFHPVSERFTPAELFGELEPKDTELLCAGGFVTETQVWYQILDDGTFLSCQIIHSSIGLWYPTIQFCVKIYDPKTKETTWRSVNVANFTAAPPNNPDKRSSKADQFSVTYKSNPGSSDPESYIIQAQPAPDLQISLTVSRPASAPGWKVGKGPQGGYSYFGADPEKADGYVIHRFWPHTSAAGMIIKDGKAIEAKGIGMFVHAIQGMRPNLVASRWNFGYFHSPQLGGTSAIQMEFTTLDAYGPKGAGSGGVKVNIGSVVAGGKLLAVTAETKWANQAPETEGKSAKEEVISRVHYSNMEFDPDTEYNVPAEIDFEWAASSILPEASGRVTANLHANVGAISTPVGLIEKVDVLAEIPKVLKSVVNYVSGAKPYIYQWYNPATLKLSGPEGVVPGGQAEVEGTLYNEVSYVS